MVFRLLCFFLPLFLLAQTPPAYVIQTFAGNSLIGDGGDATSALLSQPEGIGVDNAGNVYVADAGDNRVRKISPTGSIQTVAGNGSAGFSGDSGPGILAQLNHPYGIAIDRAGNLFIADLGNGRVRKLDAQGQITTVAGGGSSSPAALADIGFATDAKLAAPRNVAIDLNGTLYISYFSARQVLRVSALGILSIVAGTGKAGSSGDGSSAKLAQLSSPAGLATDTSGTLYIADSGNNRVRKIFRDSITSVYTVTGPTGLAMSSVGTLYVASPGYFGTTARSLGAGLAAKDVAVDTADNLFFTSGQLVRKLATSGAVTTVGGNGASVFYGGDGGPATAARVRSPSAIVQDDLGNFYISDTGNNRVRKINPAGMITTYAGTGEAGNKGDGSLAALAQLNAPRCLAFDSARNLYIADAGNNRVRKITPGGLIFTVADQLNDPECIAVDSADTLYVAETGANRILSGSSAGLVPVTNALKPSALAIGADGILYIAESSRISKWSRASGFSTVVDNLNNPRGLAITGDGGLLIAETGINRIRAFTSAGQLFTIAGTGAAGFSGEGGTASLAQLNAPMGLTVDLSGTIWVSDSGNNRIRSLTPSPSASSSAPDLQVTIVNSASAAPGPVASGEIITIFGKGFDSAQTQVLFDGKPATLFYVSATQINCQVPYTVTPGVDAAVSINSQGVLVSNFTLSVVNAAPGLFTVGGGAGPIAATN
ncbi:MAG: IPT/TIG domain-containing protein, partial [Acidobacteriota bacterium]|nr:IPT/TIG domain-containing protein [Acidobacteriota bacterium]